MLLRSVTRDGYIFLSLMILMEHHPASNRPNLRLLILKVPKNRKTVHLGVLSLILSLSLGLVNGIWKSYRTTRTRTKERWVMFLLSWDNRWSFNKFSSHLPAASQRKRASKRLSRDPKQETHWPGRCFGQAAFRLAIPPLPSIRVMLLLSRLLTQWGLRSNVTRQYIWNRPICYRYVSANAGRWRLGAPQVMDLHQA